MKKRKKFDDLTLPPAYEGIERQLMALFYCGVYITNADLVEVGRTIGLELGLKERMALLKDIMHEAHEKEEMPKVMQAFIQLLQSRAGQYEEYARAYPQAAPLLRQWIQKARSTAMLLQREMRSNPYA